MAEAKALDAQDSPQSCPQTRRATNVWLIGPANEAITGMKLPTNRQVMSVFFHQHLIEKQTVRNSSHFAVQAAFNMWKMANIATTMEKNAITKLEKMFERWQKLKKNANRKTQTQIGNEKAFQDDMDTLFDIAHANCEAMIKIAEDREFLEDQRGPRVGYMGQLDTKFAKKEERKLKRRESEANLRFLEEERQKSERKSAEIVAKSFSAADEILLESSENEDPTFLLESPIKKMPKQARPHSVLSENLASALDRANVSDRKATFVLAATAESLGHDVSSLAINRQSIRTARMKFRRQIGEETKACFASNIEASDVPLTIHWDGKILPDIVGHDSVDRLAVLVSGFNVDQLLGVPKTSTGTGEAISDAVLKTLEECNLTSRIKAMCFDTTASNTGRIAGACTRIEAALARDLLYLACRHHVHEIVLSDVFKLCMGPSSSPEIGLFKRFRDGWSLIDNSKYNTGVSDPHCVKIFTQMPNAKLESLQYAVAVLQSEKHPRDDYRELLELVVIFLGDEPPRGIRFMSPGAVHRARWMAKLLYSFKVFMFREQLAVTSREEKALRDICLFGSLIYVKAWMSCADPLSAPANDLAFLKSVHSYRTVNNDLATAAVTALLRHMWYVSEQLVALAFFDDAVDDAAKREMVKALKNPGHDDHPKRVQIDPSVIDSKQLADFVTCHTVTFFDALGMEKNFLWQVDPKDWPAIDEFRQAKTLASSLRVVNDTAERGIKLIQDFNETLTKNEEQKQFLLQVVSQHRLKFPEPKKSLLVASTAQAESESDIEGN